jgi:hypothetical protein
MIILKKKSLNLDEKNIEVKIFQFDTWLIYLVDLILEIIRDKKKSYHTLPEALSSIHPTTLYQKLSAQYILPHFTRSSQLNTSYHTLPEALSSIHPTTFYQKLSAQYIQSKKNPHQMKNSMCLPNI